MADRTQNIVILLFSPAQEFFCEPERRSIGRVRRSVRQGFAMGAKRNVGRTGKMPGRKDPASLSGRLHVVGDVGSDDPFSGHFLRN